MDVYEWNCPQCERHVASIYKTQFEHNKELHEQTHMTSQEISERMIQKLERLEQEGQQNANQYDDKV